MPKKLADKSIRELFEEQRNLFKGQPQLSQSYSKFLQDWEEYNKLGQLSRRAEESRDYLMFGASLKE